jgi:hypothetical protein
LFGGRASAASKKRGGGERASKREREREREGNSRARVRETNKTTKQQTNKPTKPHLHELLHPARQGRRPADHQPQASPQARLDLAKHQPIQKGRRLVVPEPLVAHEVGLAPDRPVEHGPAHGGAGRLLQDARVDAVVDAGDAAKERRRQRRDVLGHLICFCLFLFFCCFLSLFVCVCLVGWLCRRERGGVDEREETRGAREGPKIAHSCAVTREKKRENGGARESEGNQKRREKTHLVLHALPVAHRPAPGQHKLLGDPVKDVRERQEG